MLGAFLHISQFVMVSTTQPMKNCDFFFLMIEVNRKSVERHGASCIKIVGSSWNVTQTRDLR